MCHLKLTGEQEAVVKSDAKDLVIRAFAGACKTSTLRAYARSRPEKRFLYLAFNRAAAREAEATFPANVTCRTMHALAFAATGRHYQEKIGVLRPMDVVSAYQATTLQARHAIMTLERYLISADEDLGEQHVIQDVPEESRRLYVVAARNLWRDMRDAGNPLPMTHDGYLKLYQLSKPDLSSRYDAILFDEAQDANPVIADIVLSQRCGRILVGDRHQSSYAFRGCIDAMGMLDGAEEHHLTQSMRFGPHVADAASHLLRAFKAEPREVVGLGQMDPSPASVDPSRPYAVICRTNATVFDHAVSLLDKRKVHFLGGIEEYPFKKLLDVYCLMRGEAGKVRDPAYRGFRSFAELERYAQEANDLEIMAQIGVVKRYGGDLPGLVRRVQASAIESANDAHVLLCTAHRSKGLEFDQVVLADDFADLVGPDGRLLSSSPAAFMQDVNLQYVALTRAKRAVDINRQLDAFLSAARQGLVKPLPAPFIAAAGGMPPAQARPRPAGASSPGQALEWWIGQTLLRNGQTTCDVVAALLGVPATEVAERVALMIEDGRLSPVFFEGCGQVRERLRRMMVA